MFTCIGRWAATYPKTLALAWLIIGGALALIAPRWDDRTHDDDVRFIPQRFTSVRAYQLLEQAFPNDVFASRVIFAFERQDDHLTDRDLRLVDQVVSDLDQLRTQAPELKLGKIDSYKDGMLGFRLISLDRKCILVAVSLGTPYMALATQKTVDRTEEVVRHRLHQDPSAGLEMFTTGNAGMGRDVLNSSASSLEDTTWATIALVVVVLLMVYRAPLLALIPLLTIALSVWVSLNALALMTMIPGVHLVNITKIFAIVILYGAGTDYCLFLISRYREELQDGKDTTTAITNSVAGVGEALAASAGTVMVGLGLMALAEFTKVRCAGPAIALSLGVALLASLTLTPALLRLLGPIAFWPKAAPGSESTGGRRYLSPSLTMWEWISHKVASRPGLVLVVSILLLAPLVYLGARVTPTYRATDELAQNSPSLRGLHAFQRHFRAGEIGPITVLLASPTDWTSDRGLLEIDHLSRGFGQLPNVAEVRSVSQPLGVPLPDWKPDPDDDGWTAKLLHLVQPTLEFLREMLMESASSHYVAKLEDPLHVGQTRWVTRLDVILKSDPFQPESAETLHLISRWLNQQRTQTGLVDDVQAELYGITANGHDLATVTEGDRHRVNALVLGAIFIILLVLVRNLWLASYLLVTVLASYYAALGATVLAGIFWTGAPLTQIDWRVPFFLFTILVAVGEDYNILLICRALEEKKRFGPVEGMRRALATTGGAITSCGLIMAGTFATLMLAGLNTLLQIGFALAFGVLIDTFLVRPFLVPAFVFLFWGNRATAREAPKHQPKIHDPQDPDLAEEIEEHSQEIDRILAELKRAA